MSNTKEPPTRSLINVKQRKIGKFSVNSVDARELHSFLEIKTTFRDWIARRLSQYGFVEGMDFRSFLSESPNGRPSREYSITLDMAKELCMVERNEKGKEARLYFIECERRLTQRKEIKPKAIPEPDQHRYSLKRRINHLEFMLDHYKWLCDHMQKLYSQCRIDRDLCCDELKTLKNMNM